MSRYDLHYNYDDVFLRSVVVGFVNLLHDKVSWHMQTGRGVGERREVRVPFYFSTAGQERFLQDNFLNDVVTDQAGDKAEGPYNKIPRGIVNMEGVTVLSNEITNKHIRVSRTRMQEDGTLRSYSVEAFWVPLEMQFDATVHVDNNVDQFKCTEAVLKSFYKNRLFQIDAASVRVPALAYLPEEFSLPRTFDFKFDDQKSYSVKFPIHVKVMMPVFADDTEVFRGLSIQSFSTSVSMGPLNSAPPLLSNVQGGTSSPITETAASPVFVQSVVGGPSGQQAQPLTWPLSPSTPLPPGGGSAPYT